MFLFFFGKRIIRFSIGRFGFVRSFVYYLWFVCLIEWNDRISRWMPLPLLMLLLLPLSDLNDYWTQWNVLSGTSSKYYRALSFLVGIAFECIAHTTKQTLTELQMAPHHTLCHITPLFHHVYEAEQWIVNMPKHGANQSGWGCCA